MFSGCTALLSERYDASNDDYGNFDINLSSLENGYMMFAGCANLISFKSDLSSLTNGGGMFD
jgi:hypothetical protein